MGKDMLLIATGLVLDEGVTLSLDELCETCKISTELVIEMVEEGVIEPSGAQPENWLFDGLALKRLQTALHLQRDLRVNLPGAALVLDLLEELEDLRRVVSEK
jgi:chaperone modulatory protein CbpM